MGDENTKNRVHNWISQAQNDVLWGKSSFRDNFWAQTCFISQQAAVKALKALAFHLGFDLVKTHSLWKIAQKININGDIAEYSKVLDQYYITGRYPDALPDCAPYELFTKKQAEDAIQMSEKILERVMNELAK
ncbi:MAG: HEPN domain-containing protein [Oligoflexia bacterium]|nr:HEPN domain-containing protein [Oligoflexia bacterium]